MHGWVPGFISQQFENNKYHGEFDAAVVFIDIAGFTALTEKFSAEHLQGGAESLGVALNSMFAPLVHEVASRGGIIPLFAGDAFAALFPMVSGDPQSAPLQALQTALFIQQFFDKDDGRRLFQTPHGDIALSIRLGLAFGSIQWGIPGSKGHHAYYFQGDGISRGVACQEQAEAGQIVIDSHIQRALAPFATIEPLHETFALVAAVQPDLPAPYIDYQPQKSDHGAFMLDFVAELPAQAEFRDIAVVFISFDESAELARLHHFLARVIATTRQFGGYFSQIDISDKGGLLVLLFGAPVAYEHLLERAAECLRTLREQPVDLQWRAGISWGSVWAGIRGGAERCEYGTIGDVVNLAAHLASKTAWGETWVTQAVQEQLQESYWFDELGEFRAKGKRHNTVIYRLQHKKELLNTRLYQGELIGRQNQISQLWSMSQPIFEHSFAGVVYVHGEAGVGKSRLTYELQQQMQARRELQWFYCATEAIFQQSLHPFKYFLRQYFQQSTEPGQERENRQRFDKILNSLLECLPDHPASAELKSELTRLHSILAALVGLYWEDSLFAQLDPKLRFQNSLAAVKSLIRAESLCRPVVIQLEDAHKLDNDSQTLLKELTHDMDDYPVVILCLCRLLDNGEYVQFSFAEDVPESALFLKKLSKSSVGGIAEQLVGGAVTPAIVDLLAERANGNPFFVEQLCLDLFERGLIVRANNGATPKYELAGSVPREAVPTSVNSILLSRLDRLTGELKRVVQTAAVLGREFEVDILARIMRTDLALMDKIKRVESEQIWHLLVGRSRYAFKHILLRDTAYAMQLRAALKSMHLMAAEAIEEFRAPSLDNYYNELAYHYDKAELTDRAAEYYRLAGEQAASHYANDEALDYLARAIELAADQDGKYDLLLIREKIYALRGERDLQKQDLLALRQLASASGQNQLKAEASLRQAMYEEATGSYDQAVKTAQEAYQTAQLAQDNEIEMASLLTSGQALLRLGAYEAAEETLKNSLAGAEDPGLSKVRADLLRFLGVGSVELGRFSQAHRYYQEALRHYHELNDKQGESSVLNNLGIVAYSQGDYVASLNYWTQAQRMYEMIGDREGNARILSNLSSASIDIGDYQTGERYSRQALQICREIFVPYGQCFNLINMGLVAQYRNDSRAADTYSMQALQTAEQLDSLMLQGLALKDRGFILTLQERFQEARQAYERSLGIWNQLEQDSHVLETEVGLAHVALLSGQYIEAQNHIQAAADRLLKGEDIDGVSRPFYLFWVCYLVLNAVGQPGAISILHQAYERLMAMSEKIQDREKRDRFLTHVSVHKNIVQGIADLTA